MRGHQQLKGELLDLYNIQSRLVWLLRHSTDVEIEQVHEGAGYSHSASRR